MSYITAVKYPAFVKNYGNLLTEEASHKLVKKVKREKVQSAKVNMTKNKEAIQEFYEDYDICDINFAKRYLKDCFKHRDLNMVKKYKNIESPELLKVYQPDSQKVEHFVGEMEFVTPKDRTKLVESLNDHNHPIKGEEAHIEKLLALPSAEDIKFDLENPPHLSSISTPKFFTIMQNFNDMIYNKSTEEIKNKHNPMDFVLGDIHTGYTPQFKKNINSLIGYINLLDTTRKTTHLKNQLGNLSEKEIERSTDKGFMAFKKICEITCGRYEQKTWDKVFPGLTSRGKARKPSVIKRLKSHINNIRAKKTS